MKNKLIKILMLMMTIILLLGTSQVLAIDTDYYKPETTSTTPTVFTAKVGKILGVINVVGIVCSVIVVATIGIKYMWGSIEEKAEYKKTMTTYMLGALLLFSATTIPNIIYQAVPTPKPYQEYVSGGTQWCNTCNAPAKSNWKCQNGVGEHRYVTKPKYYCGHCNDPLDDQERRNKTCSNCQ